MNRRSKQIISTSYMINFKSIVVYPVNFILLFLVIYSLTFSVFAANEKLLTPVEIAENLQKGGYVLYFRHATTDHTQYDVDIDDLSKCEWQRNLSQQGKKESRLLGEAFNILNIKVGEIFTSPYCRCVDMAKIAFSRYTIDKSLMPTFSANLKETKFILNLLRKKLSKIPSKSLNTILIGHASNLRELTNIWPKPEGVVHVFKPEGTGYQHVGYVTLSEWNAIAGIK